MLLRDFMPSGRALKTCTIEALVVRQRSTWKMGYAFLFAMLGFGAQGFVRRSYIASAQTSSIYAKQFHTD
jgi:hypothetical protein